MFDQFPNLLTFLYPKESFYLFCQLNDRCHNNNKCFDKTFVKLCHPIEYLNLMWILMWWHVYYCLYFFGSNSFFSFEIIKHNIIV